MFRDTIYGINTIFETDVFPGAVVLVTGGPGSLKSGFTFNVMSRYLQSKDEYGIYMTLEETSESHTRNMRSLGIDIPPNLIISDYTDIRDRFEQEGEDQPDFLDMLSSVIKYFVDRQDENYTVMALDSLGALYSLIPKKDLQNRVFHFFKMLRESKMTSLIIMEKPDFNVQASPFLGIEGFLTDGIIEMGPIQAKQDIMLTIQVSKMRACAHSRKKHLVEVSDDGLAILSPIFE